MTELALPLMTQPLLVAPAHSLRKKHSGFLKFWKKSRPSILDGIHTPVGESTLILPTEIWLDILCFVPHEALGPLSRICKRMRWIVLPIYFRSQQIFPFCETFAFRRLSLNKHLAAYQERALQRVYFLSSDSIVPAIRELFISPYPPGYNRRHRVVHTPVMAVIELLFNNLPRFQNLTKLVLQFTPCSDELRMALSSLRLDYFELEVSSTEMGDIPIPAGREFRFNCSTSPNQRSPSQDLSLRLLFPKSIECMVAGPTGTNTLTHTLLFYPSGLTSLTTLDVSVRSSIPALLPPLPTTTVPHLTSYHGPAGLAPSFARNRTLRIARLWSSHSVSAVSAPWFLIPILPQLGSTVTTLELGVTLVSSALLETIRDAFPSLAVLSINAHLDAFYPGSVVRRVIVPSVPRRVPAILPAGMQLQRLRLGTQLAGDTTEQALFDSAHEAIRTFPADYDPTSWRRWVVDRPWYCVEWVSTGASAATGTGDEPGGGTLQDGTLRIEYGEHYFQGFERGERLSALTVDEAVKRMA
ncbi:Ubiquitin family protein [Mycena sanguinolenta]|uniref:Ubiquitin family protein n=1 Tax=Mycena sanguinolenta TaxID=230812 RepID=A0A8H6XRR9_9AGAR|nr:Ubiquitin family protein [Mycena sanguinolenta]